MTPAPPLHVRPLRSTRGRLLALAAAVAGLLALTTPPAAAHGIGGDAADRSVLGFVPLGIEHMLLGWDHLLFIGGVLLLARQWRRAATMITIFVIGHSATLIAATLAGWQVDAALVDVVIALSVVFVGAVGVFFGQPKWHLFGYVVLGFGLIHGLGLATRLQDLGLPEEGQLWRVLAFNVGIEIGQLTAILAMVAVAALLATFAGPQREQVLRTFATAGLFIGGSVAASLVAYQAATATETDEAPVAASEADCSVGDRTETLPGLGGHAAKDFYEPGEETPLGDFGHSVGDGYVAVLYPASLEDPALTELREFVTGPKGEGVLAGPHPEGEEGFTAVTAYRQLTCDEVDLAALAEFQTEWFASIS